MSTTKKETEKKDNNKEVDKVASIAIRESCGNIRRFSYMSNNLFKVLKTTKKEMLTKEIDNLNKIISGL